ncbi:SWF or SNF family helicase [Streptomyces paludis]|uniref:SWF or SNF family helicase n=2 Tax=Streptomyces paludis TaxID=2282738 RepID=A0A345I2C5_9ACTN|nr:SWF or SNF family helicase [Streptomyces paludis]AXG83099.1 SWF or SNF family helicase [Streptomyces paludis]
MTETAHAAEDEVRTFAAQPPARGRGFAATWWGRAWLQALEDTALDGQQLPKGRARARAGAVGAVSVRPGRITAVVRDRDGTAHRSDVLLRRLTDDEWDRFVEMAVDSAGHVAALLDREMPPHLMEDAASAGVELLPGVGDLEAECGCGAWDHCPHTAALCYQLARLLDQDPFVLLLLRGRTERRLLSALQSRGAARAAGAERAAGEDRGPAGVDAAAAFAARDILPPLPAPPRAPAEPGPSPSLNTETAPPAGAEAAALEFLAAATAARALRLLSDALSPGHELQPLEAELTVRQDGVRLAATAPGRPALIDERLASGTGRPPAELDLAVRAWRYGGAAALAVLDEEWEPGPADLARARAALDAAWADGGRPGPAPVHAGAARWTVAGDSAGLRYGSDGRWWPYDVTHGRWTPAGPGAHDPAAALDGMTDG